MLIEPIAGEGGILIPSEEFWRRLTALCERCGWMLILDEVQTCMGRCGTMFAAERWDLRPDLLLLGKGMAAGGQPIGRRARHRAGAGRLRRCTSAARSPGRRRCAGALRRHRRDPAKNALDNVAELERIA